MENKIYGGRAQTKEEALYGALKEFEKDILSEEYCDRAFKIHEERYDIKDFKQYKTYCDGTTYIFKITEIPLRLQEVVLPKQNDISELFYKKKYNFKERIRILFKGE